ncbi:PLP-dependent aminotransferase family protein [Vibrio sp.]|nr:PLP-dependent aminotransferase family protein [Vibrio sp.]
MTIYLNPIIKNGQAKYLSIGDYLLDSVRSGLLSPGTRLPTHREFAEQLGVSVQTVSKAYSYAEKKGAIESWTGNGTFVKPGFTDNNTDSEFMLTSDLRTAPEEVDLSIAHAVVTEEMVTLFNQALIDIAHQQDNRYLLGKAKPVAGQSHHLESGAIYLKSQGLNIDSEQLLLINGACHGLTIALSTVLEFGDHIACGTLVDHGLISRARMLGLHLVPLEMDEYGITPDALDWACRNKSIKAVSCTSSMSNPSSAHMDLSRREQIAELALKHDIYVIEDDVYGALELNRLPPITSFIPQQAFYVTSFTKTVAPGLRAGYLSVPRHFLQHASGRLAATSWAATPLPFEIIHKWICDGQLHSLMAFQTEEFSKRQIIAASIFKRHRYCSHPNGQHIWLKLPEGWTSDGLVTAAKSAGVLMTSYKPFVIDPNVPIPFVRMSLGSETNREYVKYGLSVVNEILSTNPPMSDFIV